MSIKLSLITTKEELYENIERFYAYAAGSEEEKTFFRERIQKGKAFVVICKNNEYFFCPSRYIGYKNINKSSHNDAINLQGGITNQRISQILGFDLDFNNDLETKFLNDCEKINVNPYKNKRRYWLVNEFPQDIQLAKRTKKLNSDTFYQIIENQRNIGKLGEEIAFDFEKNRIKAWSGINSSVERISEEFVNAGYDIESTYTTIHGKIEKRFIEVKATTTDNPEHFFISRNEINRLKEKKDYAYIYLVKITDKRNRKGEVYEISFKKVKNYLEDNPIAFEVNLPNNFIQN